MQFFSFSQSARVLLCFIHTFRKLLTLTNDLIILFCLHTLISCLSHETFFLWDFTMIFLLFWPMVLFYFSLHFIEYFFLLNSIIISQINFLFHSPGHFFFSWEVLEFSLYNFDHIYSHSFESCVWVSCRPFWWDSLVWYFQHFGLVTNFLAFHATCVFALG